MKKIRILMISTNPIGKDGITSVIYNIAENLDTTLFCVDIMAINKPEVNYIDRIKVLGGRYFYNNRRSVGVLKYSKALINLIKDNNYDIVHIHGNSHTLAVELFAARLAGCRVRIAHSHNTTCRYLLLNKVLTPLFDDSYTEALACGKEAGRWMFGNKKFTIINNGINLDDYIFNEKSRDFIRHQYGVKDGELLLGHVGGFNEQKNQAFLIEIFKCLKSRKPESRLFLIGDGRLREQVEETVRASELTGEVIFIGTTDRVGDFLSACDMIVMPSLYEGFPVALVEELVSGLPCVVSDVITRDVNITGDVVFVPLANNPDEWAEKIIQTRLSADRNAQSVKNIKAVTAAGLDMKKEIGRLEKFYKKACVQAYDN